MVLRRVCATVLILLASVAFPSCRTQEETIALGVPPRYLGPPPTSWADSVLRAMPLEQKVGQLLMQGIPGHYMSRDGALHDRLLSSVRAGRVGGVVLWQSDVYEGAFLLNELQAAAPVPLLVAADLERGPAMRVRRATSFPDAMAIAATRNADYAYRAARSTALEARAIGVHQNYAPVADVNTNPANPVINTRAFSDNPDLVRQMVASYVRGSNDGGVIATVKHFPGHGDAATDSHLELPVLGLNRARLDSIELAPFRTALENGVGAVMVAHLAVPAVDPSGVPTTLSPLAVDGLLRREMGFDGLVVTDAMDMAGVARGSPVSFAVVKAVQAGTDIVLLPADDDVAYAALLAAARSGELSRERLDASVHRILAAKERLGLHRSRTAEIGKIADAVATNAHRGLARDIARDAITVLRNQDGMLPLTRGGGKSLAILVMSDTDDNRTDINRPGPRFPNEPAGAYLAQLIGRRNGSPRVVRLTPGCRKNDVDAAVQTVARSDMAIIALYVKVRTSSGRIGIPESMQGFIEGLRKQKTPMAVIAFGNPYILAGFPSARALICAYGDAEPLVEAAAEALFGEIDVRGTLPVSISPEYILGAGLMLPKTTLRQDEPGLSGYDVAKFRHIDELVLAAIRDSAFPGAQLAVVKDGSLLHARSYGTYTYERDSREVAWQSGYDLASLTKVISTTAAVMKLYDGGLVALDTPAATYLPALAQGEKARITIRQLLQHRGGFPPFRPFFRFCVTREQALDSIFATPLVSRPGDSTIYSDIGMITLGVIVERLAGRSLADYVRGEFYLPLGMTSTMYNPPPELRPQIAPTEIDTVWRHMLVHGTVHDENAALLGGVAGHAGLFSSARDLAAFVQMLLNGGTYGLKRYLREETVREFLGPGLPGVRYLGWDAKTLPPSSAGTLFGPRSFGHTGFTGTSIWVDPDRALAVIFLTNRVHPTRANTKITKVRPALHDAVIRALEP